MAITREDVLHVARLARLEIPEGEVDRVRDELGAILDAVGKVAGSTSPGSSRPRIRWRSSTCGRRTSRGPLSRRRMLWPMRRTRGWGVPRSGGRLRDVSSIS